jgi:hypothetical protein
VTSLVVKSDKRASERTRTAERDLTEERVDRTLRMGCACMERARPGPSARRPGASVLPITITHTRTPSGVPARDAVSPTSRALRAQAILADAVMSDEMLMNDEQTAGKGRTATFAVVAVAAIAIGYLVMRPGGSEPTPAVAMTPPPPPPAPVEPPPPPPVVEDDAMKNTLLGLDKKEESGGINALKERSTQRRAIRAARRRPARASEPEPQDDPLEEEVNEPGLSDSTFYATMDRWRGVKSCLAAESKREEEAKGAFKLSLKVTDQGEVIDSRVLEPSNEIAKQIAPCVERSARAIRFPPFEWDQRYVVKQAKFVF